MGVRYAVLNPMQGEDMANDYANYPAPHASMESEPLVHSALAEPPPLQRNVAESPFKQ
jgi:hypothetical protein